MAIIYPKPYIDLTTGRTSAGDECKD